MPRKPITTERILDILEDALYTAEVTLWPFRNHDVAGSIRARLTALRNEVERIRDGLDTEGEPFTRNAGTDIEPLV